MSLWFGRKPWAEACEPQSRVPTPVGEPCLWCDELFTAEDNGFATGLVTNAGPRQAFYHRECFLRQISGSVLHQMKMCSCFDDGEVVGDTCSDPPEAPPISRRNEAVLASKLYLHMAAR